MLTKLKAIITSIAGAVAALAIFLLIAIFGVAMMFIAYFLMWGLLGLAIFTFIAFLIWAWVTDS